MDVKIAFLDGDILIYICICNDHKVFGQGKENMESSKNPCMVWIGVVC